MKSRYSNATSFITKDGSLIRELMHPNTHSCTSLSLAEAIIDVASETILHKHLNTEEIYHIISGCGRLTLGNEQVDVITGDTVCIPANTPHRICNTGDNPLAILCCCSPAYSDEDTELLDD